MRKPNHDGYIAAANHDGKSSMYLVYTGDNPMQSQVQEFMNIVGKSRATYRDLRVPDCANV